MIEKRQGNKISKVVSAAAGFALVAGPSIGLAIYNKAPELFLLGPVIGVTLAVVSAVPFLIKKRMYSEGLTFVLGMALGAVTSPLIGFKMSDTFKISDLQVTVGESVKTASLQNPNMPKFVIK